MERLRDILKVRAEERMTDAINSGCDLINLIIAVLALCSKKKGLKIFGAIWAIGSVLDKIRMMIVNIRSRRQCIEVINEYYDDDDGAEYESKFLTILKNMGNLKYQFTGRVDI